MNATIRRFGWPETLIAEYDHWIVLLRPQAPTLAALVLAAKGEATAFSALPAAAFAGQGRVVGDIEAALARTVRPEKINYLMLMMVDPHVHYHVVPRYAGARERDGTSYPDAGWPRLPDLSAAVALDDRQIAAQRDWLRGSWPSRA